MKLMILAETEKNNYLTSYFDNTDRLEASLD